MITQSAILPQYAPAQVLGDLIIADDNTIYTTDSLSGAIYRYHIDANEFEILVERGELGSPQGLVLDASGGYLYVADYIGGLSISGGRILASNLEQFDEPTLGVIQGDDFYFVANSHWNRFDRENKLPEGLAGPIILKLPVN